MSFSTGRLLSPARLEGAPVRLVASEMEIEDGVIWVYGVGENGVLALTDFGIESLIELKMYKDNDHRSFVIFEQFFKSHSDRI